MYENGRLRDQVKRSVQGSTEQGVALSESCHLVIRLGCRVLRAGNPQKGMNDEQ